MNDNTKAVNSEKLHLSPALKVAALLFIITLIVDVLTNHLRLNSTITATVAACSAAVIISRWDTKVRKQQQTMQRWKTNTAYAETKVHGALDIMTKTIDDAVERHETFLQHQQTKLTMKKQMRVIHAAIGTGLEVLEGGPEELEQAVHHAA
jgi:hypothetical protein